MLLSKELEQQLIDERIVGRDRLEGILKQEKQLESELEKTIENNSNLSKKLNFLFHQISFSKLVDQMAKMDEKLRKSKKLT